jgi:hypothetical protein
MDKTIDMAQEIAAQYSKAERFQTWTHEFMMQRLMELVAVSAAAERERCKWDVHSCGPTCKRYACVAMREAVEAEREAISDEWSMCVQSDLEHGVKSLNEQAAKDWFKNYPEIAKFGAWLAARGNT